MKAWERIVEHLGHPWGTGQTYRGMPCHVEIDANEGHGYLTPYDEPPQARATVLVGSSPAGLVRTLDGVTYPGHDVQRALWPWPLVDGPRLADCIATMLESAFQVVTTEVSWVG